MRPDKESLAVATDSGLLHMQGIGHSFAGTRIIDGFSLDIAAGEAVALLAPSGAGKTTLLRLALGALTPDEGEVTLRTSRASIGLVTQEDAILPWLTVRQNVLFTAMLTGKTSRGAGADALLRRYGLFEFGEHYPRAISGGMAQLVAMCRALHIPSELLVLDEAVAHIDEVHKSALIDEVRRMVIEENVGVLVVTQNPAEALLLADRLIISQKRPLRNLQEQANPLPRDRSSTFVHTDLFGAELKHLRQCLHELWT